MKIVILVPGRWHAFDLAKELYCNGALHKLITAYPKFKTRQWGIPDDLVVSFPIKMLMERVIHRIGGDKFGMKCQYLVNNIFAHQAASRVAGATLLHAWSGSSEPALIKAKSLRIPTVLERSSAHMLDQCQLLHEEYSSLGLKWTPTPKRTVERELREYQLAAKIAVPSIFVERTFISRGFPKSKLHRNGFGVNISAFVPGHKRDNIFRVIYVGSLSVRKGIHHLVRAFKTANLPSSELLLIGGSSQETSILLGEPDSRIRLIGHRPQSELPAYYHQSSVFVMPSIEEGQAMVQVQALACGLPLICTTNTGGQDLIMQDMPEQVISRYGIIEYPAGYVVPPRSSDAIALCLVRLAEDMTLIQRKKNAAIDVKNNDISWKRYAQGALKMYDQVIAVR